MSSELQAGILTACVCWLTTLFLYAKYVKPSMLPLKAILTEFAGKAVFQGIVTVAGCMVAYFECSHPSSASCSPASAPYVIPAVVWLLIVFLAYPTGAHLNPVISAGVWATGDMTFKDIRLP